MREIKFRAWDKKQEEVVKRFLPDWGNITQERYLLLQYTGLKDKNGREIYEGDILNIYPETGEVKFIRGSFTVIGLLVEEYCFKSEVIGNIYENPELLKEQRHE